MADGCAVAERWYSAAELAGLPGLPRTERRVRARAEREQWSGRRRAGSKGKEYPFSALPSATQTTLLLRDRREANTAAAPREVKWTEQRINALWDWFARLKKSVKDVAAERLKAVNAVQALLRAGVNVCEARAIVAAQMQRDNVRGASAASLARWQDAVAGAHPSDWIALLAPAYAGRTSSADIDAEAWELFKADYLRLERPSAASCYVRLQRIAAGKPDWAPLPSLPTLRRRIERQLPRHVVVLAREGEEALMRTFPAQERDRASFGAMEGVNADGHRFDVFVRLPDRSAIVRPIIVGWQDLGSGKILAWRLGETESSDLVRLSFIDMVTTYGVPQNVWLDNGRSFASKYLTGGTPTRYRFKVRAEDPVGIMTQLVGADGIHWVTPYHGQAKPIERAWRDFADVIAKHPAFAGAYVGNNPTAKPENYGSRAVEWAEFERIVSEEVIAHNAREGRRTALCGGRSFDAVFAEKYAGTTVRKATVEQLRTMLLAAEAVSASTQDGSVRLAGNRYWTEALAVHAGRKVVLRFDPMQLHAGVHVYALDNAYIGYAECIARVGFADTNAARETARATKQYRKVAKAMLQAERRMDAAAVAAQIPPSIAPDLPETTVIAPMFCAPAPRSRDEVATRTGTDDGPTALDLEMYRRAVERKRRAEGLE